MPTITVEGPPIDVEKKRQLVKRLYDAAVDVYKIEHITVVIKENPPENVGVEGKLLADRSVTVADRSVTVRVKRKK